MIIPDDFFDELENGLGDDGDLTLIIGCTKCGETFELSRPGATLAILMKTTFIEYLRYIQNSKCPTCNPKKEN